MLTMCVRMENVGFLVSDVSRLLRRRFDARARLIGVTRAQWRVLTTLSRVEGINQGGLADRLEVEPITLCRMIDRLEEAGHVERRRDPTDRRVWRIYLTDTSRPLLDKLHVVADGLLDDALAGIDDHSRTLFSETLQRIRDNLTAIDTNEADHG
ncbi:MarR family winged helix-turn-helix transcriptional regulator [Sphingomonas hylomeconis]|nr:MarR family transcriptional regulator [Sphingomonas hylomeconis]